MNLLGSKSKPPFAAIGARSAYCLGPLSPNFLPLRRLVLLLLFFFVFFFAINHPPPFVIDESAWSGDYSASYYIKYRSVVSRPTSKSSWLAVISCAT
jgi:hypothetical protein